MYLRVKEGATLLADLLYKSTGLCTLGLHSAEHWMQHEPRLVDALSCMTQLTEIELQVLGPNTSRFLSKMQSAPRKLVLRAPPQRVVRAPAQQPFGARLDLDPQLQLLSVEYLAALDNSNLPGLVDLARLFPSTRSLDTSLESTRPARGQPLVVIDWPTPEYVRGSAGLFANWRNATSTYLLELVDQLHLQGPRKARTVVNLKARVFLAAVDSVQPASFWHDGTHPAVEQALRAFPILRRRTVRHKLLSHMWGAARKMVGSC
ncbi:hypothetical protein DAEQUDRAFT_468911 [Daedalea quercina L-15889]|uniref:F-box domain-containing protein n=1 Tax=Daedalea quercina L-15889 TaxID=1314783 RepID=A0A165TGK7_9APHY|nr:hypothetical protein DAEQUDRAFT_468911 [Daedalea quercina L-15889]